MDISLNLTEPELREAVQEWAKARGFEHKKDSIVLFQSTPNDHGIGSFFTATIRVSAITKTVDLSIPKS